MFLLLTPHLNWCRTITKHCSFFFLIETRWSVRTGSSYTSVPANTVRRASALLNAAVQFHTPKQSRAPVSARLINRWHRWGERGHRRWTLRTLPQPQLSCQLPLTHRCQLWPWWIRPVKENSPSLHLKPTVSLSLAASLPRSPPHRLFSASTHVSGRQSRSTCRMWCKLSSIQSKI